MSIIQKIQAAIPQRSLIVGLPEVRSLRLYFNNTPRHHRAPIRKLGEDLIDFGPWPLERQFHADSLVWLRELFLRKDGTFRDTPQTRRVTGATERLAILNLTSIEFVGITSADTDSSMDYECRYHPGKERMSTYAVFRALGGGRSFLFFHLPHQASYLAYPTGLNVVPSTQAMREDWATS